MAVSTTQNRIAYQGNGSSAVFNFPYRFHAQTHLGVFVYNSSVTDGSLIVPKVLNTDYTISGTANNQGIYVSGANVIFNSSPNAQAQVVIFRSSVVTNDFALSQNGAIPSTALNNELDYLTLIAQRYQDQASRAVKMADGYPGAFDPNLPANLATSAGKRLIVNSSATGWTFDETLGSYIPNTVVVSTSNSSINSLPGNIAGLVLTSNGSSLPSWQTISVGSGAVSTGVITGILAAENGGTGTGSIQPLGGVIFAGSGGVFTSDGAIFSYDNTNNFLGIGTATPDARFTVSLNSSLVAPPVGAVMHMVGNDASNARFVLDAHGNSATGQAAGIIFRRSRGTAAAPTAVNADQTIGFIGASGYGDTAFGGVTGVSISMKAAQNWTDANQGTYLQVNLNANSTSTTVTRLRLEQDGALKLSAYANQGLILSGSGGVLAGNLLTTLGDIPYMGPASVTSRLGVGAAGQILTASSAQGIAWANSAAGFVNPMTSGGDLIVGSGAGVAERLNIGAIGQGLEVGSGSTVGWVSKTTTSGDLIVGSSGAITSRLGKGTAGQFLQVNSSTSLGVQWSTPRVKTVVLLTFGSTYIPSPGTLYFEVCAVAPGGSGGNAAADGLTAGSTVFGTSLLTPAIICHGGGGGAGTAQGPLGGLATGGDLNVRGGHGGSISGTAIGGYGGASFYGGGGPGKVGVNGSSLSALAFGAGGGGGGSNAADGRCGGAAGGYATRVVSVAASSYLYAIGLPGAARAGNASTYGESGAGASSVIFIHEYGF